MKRTTSFVASLVLVTGYLIMTLLAWMNFPSAYSPARNWLSDLGSSQLNPGGAIFYNIGIVVTGVCALVFFLGLSSWAMAGNKAQNAMLLLTRIFGVLGSLAMILSAFFPINVPGTHAFWSALLYILLGTAFAFSVAALRYHTRFPRWLLYLGVLIALEDMLWGMVLNTFIFEWITVALFLGYILLLGIETRQKAVAVA